MGFHHTSENYPWNIKIRPSYPITQNHKKASCHIYNKMQFLSVAYVVLPVPELSFWEHLQAIALCPSDPVILNLLEGSKVISPQGLGACSFLHQDYSSPRFLHVLFLYFIRSLLKYEYREELPDHPKIASSLFYLLPHYISLHSTYIHWKWYCIIIWVSSLNMFPIECRLYRCRE